MTAPSFHDVLKQINLREPHPAMFDTHAKVIADALAASKGSNKSSQIRRFYDELLRYQQAANRASEQEFNRLLPFIKMLNARAAYAQQRKADKNPLVTSQFTDFLRALLDKVADTKTLRHACTMFEAVIGFSPKDSPKDRQ
jgi:CRISPR-associated protein Csm2